MTRWFRASRSLPEPDTMVRTIDAHGVERFAEYDDLLCRFVPICTERRLPPIGRVVLWSRCGSDAAQSSLLSVVSAA